MFRLTLARPSPVSGTHHTARPEDMRHINALSHRAIYT